MGLIQEGRHSADKTGWWARRSFRAKIGIITLVLLALSGIAYAVYVTSNSANGGPFSFSVAEEGDVVIKSIGFSNPTGGAACTGSKLTDGTGFTISTWPDFEPGDQCKVSLIVEVINNNTDLFAGDVVVGNNLVVGTINGTYCHANVSTNNVTASTTGRADVIFTVQDRTVPDTYTFSFQTGDGIDYFSTATEGDCTSAT